MSLVHVFAASELEGRPIEQIAVPRKAGDRLSSAKLFRSGTNDLDLTITGMGTAAAKARAATALEQTGLPRLPNRASHRPDAVLAIGLCGGLSDSLQEGRIVAYTDCLSAESGKASLSCSSAITANIAKLLASSNIACDRVTGVTSTRIATNRQERLRLAQTGASAVDMETYSILDAATRAGVPVAVLRVVSDSFDRELPDLNRALNQDGALDSRKALAVAIGSPLRTLRLLAANKRAMQSLGDALRIVLPSDCFSHSG